MKLSLGFICFGFISIFVFLISKPDIDTSGILHEPFFLIPTGIILILIGILRVIFIRIKSTM